LGRETLQEVSEGAFPATVGDDSDLQVWRDSDDRLRIVPPKQSALSAVTQTCHKNLSDVILSRKIDNCLRYIFACEDLRVDAEAFREAQVFLHGFAFNAWKVGEFSRPVNEQA
jgi:hypothetical protein